MAYEFRLPDLGEGLTEGEVARWLVAEGQEVAEDDPLVEIQTDKATVEVPSPAAGTVAQILVAEGDVVPVGTVLVVIGGDTPSPEPATSGGQEPATSGGQATGPVQERQAAPAPPPRPAGERARATPLVRRIARDLGVDLESVAGTGPQGRVSEADVRLQAMSGGQAPGPVQEGQRVPLRGIRRLIASHMATAQREVPAVTWVEECEFDRVDLERLVATTIKACAVSLQEFRELNARLEGDEIVYLDRYDIGVAVQTDAGLVVPVVRGCDTRSLAELDAEVRRLADAARSGQLAAEELRGSTFTVTSAGRLAGLLQTPIVNYPEVAILSVGRIVPRPVVRDGEIVVREVGTIAVTFDHRVVDGARAAAFGLAVIEQLERPRGA
jgi:pyruvate dehydrogenase E2 component (dihydrolipoamide acetyltransferase)